MTKTTRKPAARKSVARIFAEESAKAAAKRAETRRANLIARNRAAALPNAFLSL